MKKTMKVLLTAIMLAAFICMPSIAGQSPHRLSTTVDVGTDAYSRGMSYTDNEWAIGASLDYEHAIGFYAGVWVGKIAGDSVYLDHDSMNEGWTYNSNSGDVEIDVYFGYWVELGPIELDLMATFYHFPNNADAGLNRHYWYGDWSKGESEADYWEFHIGLAHRFNLPTVPKLSVGYDFSPDYWGEDGLAHHANAVLEIGLPFEFVLAGEVGYQWVEGGDQTGYDPVWNVYYGEDNDQEGFDYMYYRVGISREVFGINLDLSYHFGNSEKDWLSDDEMGYGTPSGDRVIFTGSYTFTFWPWQY